MREATRQGVLPRQESYLSAVSLVTALCRLPADSRPHSFAPVSISALPTLPLFPPSLRFSPAPLHLPLAMPVPPPPLPSGPSPARSLTRRLVASLSSPRRHPPLGTHLSPRGRPKKVSPWQRRRLRSLSLGTPGTSSPLLSSPWHPPLGTHLSPRREKKCPPTRYPWHLAPRNLSLDRSRARCQAGPKKGRRRAESRLKPGVRQGRRRAEEGPNQGSNQASGRAEEGPRKGRIKAQTRHQAGPKKQPWGGAGPVQRAPKRKGSCPEQEQALCSSKAQRRSRMGCTSRGGWGLLLTLPLCSSCTNSWAVRLCPSPTPDPAPTSRSQLLPLTMRPVPCTLTCHVPCFLSSALLPLPLPLQEPRGPRPQSWLRGGGGAGAP